MVPVYYFPSHPYNTISPGALKFYVGFQKVTSEHIGHCEFLPSRLFLEIILPDKKNLDYLQIENFQIKSQRDRNIVVPTVFALKKKPLSQLIHQSFGHVSITRIKQMARKGLM